MATSLKLKSGNQKILNFVSGEARAKDKNIQFVDNLEDLVVGGEDDIGFVSNGGMYVYKTNTWVGANNGDVKITNVFSATEGQTVFTSTVTSPDPFVFINGSLLTKDIDYTYAYPTLTLVTGAVLDDEITVSGGGALSVPEENTGMFYVETVDDLAGVDTSLHTVTVVKDLLRGGTFVYDASAGADDGGTIFGKWVRQYDGAVNVKWFGAVGDGIADDIAGIQLAIDMAIQSQRKEVYIPKGTYKISDTIQVGYAPYTGINIVGDGNNYNAEPTLGGTIILVDFVDRPGIAVQSSRLSSLSKFTIKGLNYDHIKNDKLGFQDCTILDTDVAVWTTPGVSDGQFNPYCGIAIDPYCGTRPVESYPDVNYPAWTGITEQYGKAGGSQVRCDDISVYGFHVGIALQPCDFDANGDFMTFDKVTIAYCAYGYSAGNSQTRQNSFTNSLINVCHTAYTTVVHGKKRGKLNTLFSNTNFDVCLIWAHIDTVYGAPRFDTCYAEQAYIIVKDESSSSGKQPINFTSCAFSSTAPEGGVRGAPAYMFYAEKNSIHFINCTASFPVSTSKTIGMLTFNQTCDIKLQGCGFKTANMPANQGQAVALNMSQNGGACPSSLQSNTVANYHKSFDVDTLGQLETYIFSTQPVPNTARRNETHPIMTEARSRYMSKKHTALTVNDYISTSTWTNIVESENSITVDIGTSDVGRCRYRVDLGDFIYYSDTYYYVEDRVGTVITLRAVNNYAGDLTLHSPIPASPSGDVLYWHSRRININSNYEYFISFTVASNVANVRRAQDNYTGGMDSDFAVGDRLYEIPETFGVFRHPTDQKITAIDSTAGTLTFEGTAYRTVDDVLIYLLSRTFNS